MRGFNPNSNKGFTLIELMIVVAIVGILAAVAVPSYLKHVHRTRQSEGVTRLLDIKTAQEKFYALNDLYVNEDPLSGTVNTEFTGMLNFAVTDTVHHDFAIDSPTATNVDFRVELYSDLNEDGTSEMCWAITDSTTEPVRFDAADAGIIANALNNNCDDGPDAEDLKFTTMLF